MKNKSEKKIQIESAIGGKKKNESGKTEGIREAEVRKEREKKNHRENVISGTEKEMVEIDSEYEASAYK